ncbi:MAG: galactose-1-phosphate uridylyltransferase [Hyphomonadaceae bacterium]|nr:galactose-1-phosphate uridylyltransferase [Clostridia bacterium]
MAELRQNPITGEWTIISCERAGRPYQFDKADDHSECPFCIANEQMIISEIARLGGEGDGWHVRAVPNKYPIVAPCDCHWLSQDFYLAFEDFGQHEVIIETPEHNQSLEKLEASWVTEVFEMYQNRIATLLALPQIQYVQIFKNNGRLGGASLPHPHSQVVALPHIPSYVQNEMAHMEDYHKAHQKCLLCDIIHKELTDGCRLVLENEQFVAFVPYAPRYAFEVCIAPKMHHAQYETTKHLDLLAQCFKQLLEKTSAALGEFSYNLLLHTLPKGGNTQANHWHMALIPRVSHHAGFELATGSTIHIQSPEKVAEKIRG